MRKSIIISVVLGALTLIGVGGYLVAKEFQHLDNNEKIKMENKLLIGTYKESSLSNGDTSFNKLYIEIVNNGEVRYKKNVITNDKNLTTISQNKNCVFVDLSEEIKKYTNELGIYFWSKSNPNKNYIRVRSECIALGIVSGECKINDSGMYLINLPQKNGEIPQVVHSYIYQKSDIRWWF